jgi:hypothetical protein
MSVTLKQLRPLACHTRAHCATCRTDADWRERVTGVRDFDCPHGVAADKIPSRGLGDTIAKVTKAVGIKPCGGCKNRQAKLNKLVPYKDK